MQNRRVLIVGTGIAGPTLAVWLDRFGFEPTLVERAPALRRGGYLIGFWGAGFDVAERMGLIADLRRHAVTIDEVRFVDDDGRRRGGFGGDVMRAALGDRYFSILRSDLSQVIYDALGGGVRTLFDDTVTDLHQAADGVLVEFLHAPAEQFDLVIGAGGLHSRVRRLVFGPETLFEKYLGYYVASFSADDYPDRKSVV